jgi:hypothetical protein
MIEPVFIIGFQRSGTTLLRLMLDAHPQLAIPLDPVGLWEHYAARLDEYAQLATCADVERLVRDIAAEERIRLWELRAAPEEILARVGSRTYSAVIEAFYRTYAASRGKLAWGDKDPGNMLRMHQVNAWFPAARFVHIIRDGRDACLSQLQVDFGFDDFLDCASGWCEQVTWVRRIGAILGPDRYREVRYEDLVTRPEHELRALCPFLGLEYTPAMLEYHRDLGSAITESKQHLWPLAAKPPQADNAGRWRTRISRGSRVCFEKRAGKLLGDLGYEVLPKPWSGGYGEEVRHIFRGFMRTARRQLRRRTRRP